jgi:hypothetical protein
VDKDCSLRNRDELEADLNIDKDLRKGEDYYDLSNVLITRPKREDDLLNRDNKEYIFSNNLVYNSGVDESGEYYKVKLLYNNMLVEDAKTIDPKAEILNIRDLIMVRDYNEIAEMF